MEILEVRFKYELSRNSHMKSRARMVQAAKDKTRNAYETCTELQFGVGRLLPL